jgi:alanine-synthesizing transaminase
MDKIMASQRSKNVKYAIRDIAVLAKKVQDSGKKVTYLNIGDPNKFDFDTPQEMRDAVTRAMNNHKNYYADSMGELEAREAIVKHNNKIGIDCTTDDIILTTGVSEGIQLCVGALLNRGDNMLIPSPSYPLYSGVLDLFEGEKNFYTLDEEKDWELNPEDIEKRINSKTKAIVVINPNNPTGGLYDKKTLKEVVNIAGQHNLAIFADEIYDEMILEGEMQHIASFSNEVPVLTFNGLAKNFLCPGWRIGWMTITDRNNVMDDFKQGISQLARARLCSTTPLQYAVKPALEGNRSHMSETIKKLKVRRDLTYKRINEINGLSLRKPRAAFYAFPKIEFDIDDKKFVLDLLEKEGVAVVHGSGFDMSEHFRIVYLATEDILNDAYDKLERYVESITC